MTHSFFFMKQWSPFEREDKIALVIGIASAIAIMFAPRLALIGSLIGISVASIPPMKNVWENSYAENLTSWVMFMGAGTLSFLSGVFY